MHGNGGNKIVIDSFAGPCGTGWEWQTGGLYLLPTKLSKSKFLKVVMENLEALNSNEVSSISTSEVIDIALCQSQRENPIKITRKW